MSREWGAALEKEFPFMRRENRDGPGAYQQYGIEAGSGWCELIRSLCQELAELCAHAGREAGFVVDQVKEKHGKLRFRCHFEGGMAEENTALHRALYAVIERYEEASGHVCEICGAPGETRTLRRFWRRTLCDAHFAACQSAMEKKKEQDVRGEDVLP